MLRAEASKTAPYPVLLRESTVTSSKIFFIGKVVVQLLVATLLLPRLCSSFTDNKCPEVLKINIAITLLEGV